MKGAIKINLLLFIWPGDISSGVTALITVIITVVVIQRVITATAAAALLIIIVENNGLTLIEVLSAFLWMILIEVIVEKPLTEFPVNELCQQPW